MDLRHQALCHTMTLCSPRSTQYQKNAGDYHLRGCWVLQGLGTSLSVPGPDQERSGFSFLKENEKALAASVLTSLLKGRDHVRVPKESQSTDSQPTMKGNKDGDKIEDLSQTARVAFPAYVGSLGHFLRGQFVRQHQYSVRLTAVILELSETCVCVNMCVFGSPSICVDHLSEMLV